MKRKKVNKNLQRLLGFDTEGEVFVFKDEVFRGIYKDKGAYWRKILKICKKNNLFNDSLVKTKLASKSLFPNLSYDLVLEHEKVPFISYPHEWTAGMLKDAALLHIDLLLTLNKFDLTLKDFHPFNILFDNSKPIFVDFTSIIFADELINENYLAPGKCNFPFNFLWNTHSKYFYEMYKAMFAPYLLFPLYLMKKGQFKKTRLKMLQSTLNASTAPVFRAKDIYPKLTIKEKTVYKFIQLLKWLSLTEPGNTKKLFLKILKKETEAIKLPLDKSSWTEYYKRKGEDFSFKPSKKWTAKHRAIYQAIKRLKPKTVLDVGCNTGWFSIMAANLGCQVVAVDIDEASMNLLYKKTKEENLSILPLAMNLNKLTPDVSPIAFDNKLSLSLIKDSSPLLIAAEKRLKCDMVLALAIVHHLIIGQNKSLREVFNTLAGFATEILIVEYVSLKDEVMNPQSSFFKNLPNYNAKNYNIDLVIKEGRKHFNKVKILGSNSSTRKLLVFKK